MAIIAALSVDTLDFSVCSEAPAQFLPSCASPIPAPLHFSNETFGSIRTIMRDGEPWFVAADVCKALEINNNRMAVDRLDEDEKDVILTDTPGGKQNTTIINEPGLYTLVLGSRKPEAKAFKRWITHDVIPSLRKNGAYIMGQETMTEVELIAKAI